MVAYPNCKSESTARRNASRLLTNADICHAIKQNKKEVSKKGIASAEEVLKFFSEVYQNERYPTRDRIRSAENLAKFYGLLKEKVEVDGGIVITLGGELEELAE